MYYIELSKRDVDLSEFNIIRLVLELDEEGNVLKELGYSKDGSILHLYPSIIFKYGTYGFCDLVHFEINSLRNDLTHEEFEVLWAKANTSSLMLLRRGFFDRGF